MYSWTISDKGSSLVDGYTVSQEAVSILDDAYHGLTGIEFYLVTVVIIVFGRFVVSGLFPVYMDCFTVGDVVTVSGGIMYLKCQITLCITHLVIGTLNNDVLEGKLFVGGTVYIGFSVNAAVI